MRAPLLSLVIWLCLACLPAFGWLRPTYEDAIVVERSELIVVAHIKEGSIKYVRHANKPGEGNSYEHHAILVITEVLKGKTDKKEIPIIIHYGLTPLVGGYVERDGFMLNLRGWRKDYPKNIIEIMDTGNSAMSLTPLVKDAREDNLWFLRKRSGIYGRKPGTGNYGIVDPQDLRPASLKDYFKAYLSATPEKSVREYVAAHPEFAERAQSYFDHLEVQRISKLADPRERVEKLIPFVLKSQSWSDDYYEARKALIACGDPAGPPLLRVFDDPMHRKQRDEIMTVWGEIKYAGCVDRLIRLLEEHDAFFESQNLKGGGWWNAGVGDKLNQKRRDVYGEVYDAVRTLRQIRCPRARKVLELTRKRWRAMGFSNPQILRECEAALKELDSE